MFKGATFKLTMWYLAIVIVISLCFSMVLYRFAVNELNTRLNSQTQRIYQQFPVFTNNPYLRVRDSDLNRGAHHIFLQLVYFNLLVLGGAGLASYFLARRTLEPIAAAHDRQQRFTADVSHELRTPLTALKMGSEVALLDPKASKPELQAVLRSNLEDAGRMEQLINNLLRLTKLDNEALAANFNDISSQQLITEALNQVAPALQAKKMKVENNVAEHTVHGDAESLTQLLVILLDNAIKYSPAKTTIQLSSQKKDDNLLIKLQDQGQGIGPEAIPHVFERFYREDKARTTTDNESFGLGLSIAKMIADRNQASITLTSRLDKGTTALVSLPLATTLSR